MVSISIADELSGSARKLYESIDKLVIRKGILIEDPSIWELHILGKVIKADAKTIEDYGVFRKQFIQTFDVPAPLLSRDEWWAITMALSDEKNGRKIVVENEEESEKVCIARQLLEILQKLPISEDDVDALSGKSFLKKDNSLYLISEKINELLKEHDFKISTSLLSPAMTELGFKTAGTKTLRLDGIKKRVWEFNISAFTDTETVAANPTE